MLGRAKKSVAGTKKSGDSGRSVYSEFYHLRSGIFTSTILSLILWWVPFLGPIMAGFMGGRKGGSLLRGALTGAISCVLVVAIAAGLNYGLTTLLTTYSAEISSFSVDLYEKSLELKAYFDTLVVLNGTSISVDLAPYSLVLALSIIGGVYADQSREETKVIASLAADYNKAPVPRSMKAYAENRQMGFTAYEDYTRMSVNVSGTETPQRSLPATTQTSEPEPVAESVVYVDFPSSVEQTSTASTTTMTSSVEIVETHVPDSDAESVSRKQPKDDFEYL